MKRLLLTGIACSLFAIPAIAADIAITFSDHDQQAIALAPQIMGQCVSGMIAGNDVSACRDIAGFLLSMQKRVEAELAPKTPPPPNAAPVIPPPAPPAKPN